MKDRLNNNIEIGSYVVYAHRRGSNMGLRVARITGFGSTKLYAGEPIITAKARGLDERTNKPTSIVTLTVSAYIVVLHPDTVPAEYKEILG